MNVVEQASCLSVGAAIIKLSRMSWRNFEGWKPAPLFFKRDPRCCRWSRTTPPRSGTSKHALTIFVVLAALNAISLFGSEAGGQLENKFVSWNWTFTNGRLRPATMHDRLNDASIAVGAECFRIELGDGTILNSSDFNPIESPTIEPLSPEPDSPTSARHEAGHQLVAKFSLPEKHLSAEWRVILRDGSPYIREELTLRAVGKDVLVKEIVLFDGKVPGAKTDGTVDGSPVVAGNFFFGYEHPMARNTVAPDSTVHCSFVRNAVLKTGESLAQSCVIGVVPDGQLRRGFLGYVERERAHPYRPFLHYNSWFDIAWDKQKYDEAKAPGCD